MRGLTLLAGLALTLFDEGTAFVARRAGGRAPVLPTTPARSAFRQQQRLTVTSGMGGATPQSYDGVRIGPPPDLPSLLLHNRIVYIGMPLVPAVTELIIAELLYLNYESADKVRSQAPKTSTPGAVLHREGAICEASTA